MRETLRLPHLTPRPPSIPRSEQDIRDYFTSGGTSHPFGKMHAPASPSSLRAKFPEPDEDAFRAWFPGLPRFFSSPRVRFVGSISLGGSPAGRIDPRFPVHRTVCCFYFTGPIESIGTEQDARDEDARGAERGRTGRSSRRPAARSRPNLDQSRRRATLKARARRARRVIFRLPEARGSGGVAEVFQLRGE